MNLNLNLNRASALLLAALLLACGAPARATTQPVLKYQAQTGLTITGAVGTVYAVLTTTNLTDSSGWRCLKFLQLSNTTYLMPGTAATNGGCRFYRVAGMTLTNFVLIPPGTFVMGSPTNEVGRYSDEGPQTTVTFSQSLWIAKYLVTQQEYQSVMGSNPSFHTTTPSLPVEQVSWMDATNYCTLRTIQERASGKIPNDCHYRLPTEAEWEYACRAGTTTRFNYGDDPGYSTLTNRAWYTANSTSQSHAVGLKPANAWGLFDMHGNVWEWCSDWYDTSYPGGSVTDPQGPLSSLYGRVLRGGSWADPALLCRAACRVYDVPEDGYSNYGFRVVLVAGGQ